MKWIKPVVMTDNNVMIPFINDERYRVFEWHEGESIDDFFKRNGEGSEINSCYTRIMVWAKHDNENNEPDGTFQITVYEVIDIQKEEFYLIMSCDFTDPDDIKQAILIPRHTLNIRKFCKEYLLPFSDANIFVG